MRVRGLRSVFSFAHSRVVEAHFSPDSAMVRIALDRRRKPRCPRCDGVAAIEQKHRRRARDLPFLAMAQPTLIEYEAAKARCPKCGTRSWIVPEGIDAARSITQRLMLHAGGALHLIEDALYPDTPWREDGEPEAFWTWWWRRCRCRLALADPGNAGFGVPE